jgi:preprotein translocase subunit SecA
MVNGRQVAVRESNFDPKIYLTDLIKGTKEYATGKQAKVDKQLVEIEKTALNNGLKLSDSQKIAYAQRIQNGEDVATIQQSLRKIVADTMPKNVQELMAAGNDLSDVYAPYRQAMATTLELPYDKIDLTDPALTGAISQSGNMPLYEYQRALKKDNRWQYTNNARDEVSSSVNQVLKDFGFVG